MNKNIAVILVFVASTFFLPSCDTFEGHAETPSYIQIDSVNFVSNVSTEGTNKQKITDIWYNVEGNRVGAFEIPTRFPVIAEGKKAISMYAGILKNGIHIYREIYPFFEPFKDTIVFKGTEIIKTNPTFKYKSELDFWIEDFEDPGLKFHTISEPNYLNQVQDPNVPSNSLGHVYLPDTARAFQFFTKNKFKLLYSPIYMEIEYKCDHEFSIGIIVEKINGTYESIRPFSIIKRTDKWNKLYLNLAEQFSLNSEGISYEVYFFFAKDNALPINFYFDNIKIITYDKN